MVSPIVNTIWPSEAQGLGDKFFLGKVDNENLEKLYAILLDEPTNNLVDTKIAESLWLLPLLIRLSTTREGPSTPSLYAENLREIERILGCPGDPRNNAEGLGCFRHYYEELHSSWAPAPTGFLGQVRKRDFSEKDMADYVALLKSLPRFSGNIPREIVSQLWPVPTYLWEQLKDKEQSQRQLLQKLLPSLGDLLGEPRPGLISAILSRLGD